MDKNLEIIKNNEPKQVWDQEDGDFYLLFVPEMWDQVIVAAERMANEIARLKAELKNKPDIVKCGECKNWHPIEFLENTYSLTKLQGPCMLRKDNTFFYENDFCSNGQR